MPKKYPHLQIERKAGKAYYYVRLRAGGPRTSIRGEFGSPNFLAQYAQALQSQNVPAPKPQTAEPHTLTWLVSQYMQSYKWTNELEPSTRKNRGRYLAKMTDVSGKLPFHQITSENLQATKEKMKNTPNSANNFVRAVRGLFNWAYENKLIKVNPAQDLKKFKTKSDGHEPWIEEDVYLFRQSYQVGSRERLAFEMLISTGLRRSDVCRVGKHHIRNGILSIKCQKTKTQVHIPVSKSLSEILEKSPQGELTILSTGNGKPFTVAGFGNYFGATCKKIGITKSAHGLRKYLATQLADAGASERELKAFFGWANSKEAEVYTKNADVQRLSTSALQKLSKGKV